MHPFDLPLKHLDLVPQGQHFGLQLGLVGVTGRKGVKQYAQERIKERPDHPSADADQPNAVVVCDQQPLDSCRSNRSEL
jgi:hypothetical protein